jgi:CopG antitoxin of type II toxin-antitoxin system
MKSDRIPQTDSIKELAKFWDTHDLTDFEAQLEDIDEPVFARDMPIRIRLPAREAVSLRQIAAAKGISAAELVQEWVRQRLARFRADRSKKRSG